MKKPIYLDYAAATPLDDKVLSAMTPYFSKAFYNPSATYLAARAVADDLQAARSKIAYWLGARPSEVLFTAGGTEANNLAIDGVMRGYPHANIVVSSIEHDSVLGPAGQYNCRVVPVNQQGLIDLDKLEAAIDQNTALVSIMYANNEIGTIQPLAKVSQIIKKNRHERVKKGHKLPIYLHTDAAQAANYLKLFTSVLGVDMMTLNGGKIYGPKQSGALIIKAGTVLKPLLLGGGQEQGLRSGTENVAGSIGFATALDMVQSRREAEVERLQALQSLFYQLLERELPSCIVNGSRDHRLPNNVHATLPGQDNERLMIQLDEVGIICAAGSACSASSEEPSHVLKAIGLSKADAQASLRFTMGNGTTDAEVRATVDALVALTR